MEKQGIVLFLILGAASSAFAGAEIDLRPTPPVPPEGYLTDTLVNVDVFLVDTGNPEGDISFRARRLDFTDTTGTLTYPGPDGIPGNDDDDQFTWFDPDEPLPFGFRFPDLPMPTWIYVGKPPGPLTQPTLPDDGEVRVGEINVSVGGTGGILDVMNADDPDPDFGAWALFGFGSEGDPITNWRAYIGELTSGRLAIPTVPEPGSVLLFAVSALALLRRRA